MARTIPPGAFSMLCLFSMLLWGCGDSARHSAQPGIPVSVENGSVRIETSAARFEVAPSGAIRASLLQGGREQTLDAGLSADVLVSGGQTVDFPAAEPRVVIENEGRGKRIEIRSRAGNGLERVQTLEVYERMPGLLLSTVAYRNGGARPIPIDELKTNKHTLKKNDTWAFFGASEKWGEDDVVHLAPGLSRANLLGAKRPGTMGGGVPVAAFWTKDMGLAVGHLDSQPVTLGIPTSVGSGGAPDVALDFLPAETLLPGESYSTPRMFTMVFTGDYYDALRLYSQAMQDRGWSLAATAQHAPDSAYEASWCGWGYLADVTPGQMLGIIPKLKEFNIHWATLDDRWFDVYGDWNPRADTFPGNSLKTMVDEYHRNGIHVQLWWLPLAAEWKGPKEDGVAYTDSKVAKEHPDWLVLDRNGKPALMARQLETLCPALPQVQDYYRRLTGKFIRDWGFDGHKLDNVFSIPPCYNPKHHHKSPQDSVNAMGDVFRVIYETTKALKPFAVTQACPCGTPPNISWLPYLNQAVTADPVGSVQVRRRIKMYKGLLGPEAPVYGDHVELTELEQRNDREIDFGRDFASTVGTGGVVGTKFVWPQKDAKYDDVVLSPEKDALWKKWLAIYQAKMLSRGEFRNLYLTGFDRPEGYAIEKAGKVYYAFFAGGPHESYKGPVEFRGLEPVEYRVFDYVNGRELGRIQGPKAVLQTEFQGSLLVEVSRI
ncbi:MAG TPA: alpha-galactosidase [Bryobacteraceae bacterium]|nr:alpha-galactosidase [Bryobacteraceae bacterium]